MRGVIIVMAMCAVLLGQSPLQAASSFSVLAFKAKWQVGEALAPNFWGPLSTARDGVNEPYKEAAGGQRLVQYFDKTRMELANPSSGTVTNGLLTVELTSGKVQTGDATFETRQPARINIAGDPGTDGPTYADLAPLPPLSPGPPGGTPTSVWHYAGNGRFEAVNFGDPVLTPFRSMLISRTYLQDPGGRYGQFVFGPFDTYLHDLIFPLDQTTGYPVSPFFVTQVKIGGTPTTVVAQAFERRVLTYNPGNARDFRVEFGNIGQHYFHWRYGTNMPTAIPSMSKAPTPGDADFGPFAQRWGSHGFGLSIDMHGNGVAGWRVYSFCKDDPTPPCDDIVGNGIIDGGKGSLIFTTVDGVVLSGQVINGTDPRTFTVGETVTLTLLPYGLAVLTRSGNQRHILCGPRYGQDAPPEVIRLGPCGA